VGQDGRRCLKAASDYHKRGWSALARLRRALAQGEVGYQRSRRIYWTSDHPKSNLAVHGCLECGEMIVYLSHKTGVELIGLLTDRLQVRDCGNCNRHAPHRRL